MHKSVHRVFGQTRAIVLGAALLAGAALPATGLWAGAASAAPMIETSTAPTVTTLSTSHSPSFYGQPVTFTAVVTPNDGGGSVSFKSGIFTIPGCSARTLHFFFGHYLATCTTSSLIPGVHLITATYSGDTNYASSTSALLQFVLRAPTHLTPDIAFNFRQTFTVFGTLDSFFHPVPGQLLFFRTGRTFLCAAFTNFHGTASCVLSYAKSVAIRQNAGRYTVSYGGSSHYLPSFALGQAIILP